MRTRAWISACLLLFLAVLPLRAGEVVDRIIAVINNAPLLLSDWDEALRCEALLAGRTPQSFTEEERKDVFDRLVDQELIRQQMRGYIATPITDAALQQRLQETKQQLAGATDETHWRGLLSQSGVTEAELLDRLRTQLEIEGFVEARFRPGMRIDDRSVSKYYRDQFLPALHNAGQKDVPLSEVSDKIREILIQQRLGEQLTAWLQTLREQAEIRFPNGTKPEITSAEANAAK
jgi:hypothetical protein